MTMIEDYNKIIESLNIKFIRSNSLNVIRSVKVSNFYDVQNTLIQVKSGDITVNENEVARAGDLVFIPGGKSIEIAFGNSNTTEVTNESFINDRDSYLRKINDDVSLHTIHTSFTSVTFDAKAFDSVNFFNSLDIPPFIIPKHEEISEAIDKIYKESLGDKPGRDRIATNITEYAVIEVFRHVLEKKLFVEQIATNSNYFKDPRLIDIFNFIKDNISSDLSNKILANVANVSEDYVGQYFKMLTGINPQDYIEYQRMEKAVELLRTSRKSIRAIGSEVGYKDTAYFCRRFKMMFGIPAGKMRRRDSLMNV